MSHTCTPTLIVMSEGRNRTTEGNVKWPAIRAWGQYHSRNIGSMGGECEPLGRRHSGKGRAVPVCCPSIPVVS
jgi:hypothetical protein